MPKPSPIDTNDPDVNLRLISMIFARMDTLAMATATGIAAAILMILATAVLLLKGAPPGIPIGGNLAALETFLPGYSVSWPGTVVGGGYGFLLGAAAGVMIAGLWNISHLMFIGFAVLRGNWLD